MTAPISLGERDLGALLGIISGDRSDIGEAGLPLSLLADLIGLVSCDFSNFTGTDSGRQEFWFGQELPADGDDDGDERAFWENYADSPMCSYPDRSGDLRSVTMLSDFVSARQWHGTGMYADVFRPLGVEHMLMLCLPTAATVGATTGAAAGAAMGPAAGAGRTLRLIFYRGAGTGFSERDRALLALLRPHVHEAYLDAEASRGGVTRLTPRQWDLLRLVAAGHTNSQAARRLGIAEGTVRKHLENTYRKLGVSSRTAAIACAFGGPGRDVAHGRSSIPGGWTPDGR